MNAVNASSSALPTALYQAVWRWHFGVGLLVLPLLAMMAITGGLYLFKNEIDGFVYRNWQHVAVRAQPPLALATLIARVEHDMDGKVLQFTPPSHAGEAIKLVVRVRSGDSRTAFADPYDGRVLGSTTYGGVMQVIRKIHSLQQFGFWASCLIEIVAGWTIVLAIMGIYLWWPRGGGGVVSVRGTPRARVFWRDLHAVIGLFAAVVIVFLAVSGMPWSMFWGNQVQSWATRHGLGQPAAPAEVTPDWQIGQRVAAHATTDKHHEHHELPWALENTAAPTSALRAHAPLDADRAMQLFKQAGLQSNFTVTLPSSARGAYMAAYRPDRTEDTRVIYLDQYSGATLGDVGYAQYGAAAKLIEWGIAVHQGTEYGAFNRYLMLAGCIAIVLLAVSSVVMWLKRRPTGSLGIPPRPLSRRATHGVLVSVAVIGAIFPLVGASLLIALLIEYCARFTRRPATMRTPPSVS